MYNLFFSVSVCVEEAGDMEGAGGGSSHQYRRGLWTEEEDKILMEHVELHGKGQWNRIPKRTGLKRCGKSCRLRWVNYLSPNVKRGSFSEEEEDLIIRLHKLLGNRWSLIAGRVPGRTDNQVKNYWNTHLSKRNGCAERRRTKPFTSTPDTKSLACSKDSVTVLSGKTVSTTTTDNLGQDSLVSENNVTGDALIRNTDAFAWGDQVDHQEMSSNQSLEQFCDEFLQFDFGCAICAHFSLINY